MTYQINSSLPTVEAVVQAFADESVDFDADIFDAYLKAYPQHGDRLKSYAQVWLMSSRASSSEIADANIPEEKVLTAQSRMLMAWEGASTSSELLGSAEAVKGLSQFDGSEGLKALTKVLLESDDENESPLAMEYLDLGLNLVPRRFNRRVGNRIHCDMENVPQALALYRTQTQAQMHFSAKGKPEIASIRTWADAVNELPVSDERKRELLRDDDE